MTTLERLRLECLLLEASIREYQAATDRLIISLVLALTP